MVAQTQDVELHLPFALLGMDVDNGSEWLNWHLVRYLQERSAPVTLTRSRPYHKDDNAHVEQKNWMWPRQVLGYQRLEKIEAVPLINRLYKETWGPLHNFFLPSAKLVAKHREGSKWVRRHDRPQTAYQRLVSGGQVESKQARRLRDLHRALDPFELARQTEQQLKAILP